MMAIFCIILMTLLNFRLLGLCLTIMYHVYYSLYLMGQKNLLDAHGYVLNNGEPLNQIEFLKSNMLGHNYEKSHSLSYLSRNHTCDLDITFC